MALVRCNDHNVEMKKTRHIYAIRVKPIGYPDTAAICGRVGCEKAGLVWLTEEELRDFNKGKRCFGIYTNSADIKVTDESVPLPK